jgi:hypothetical protein
VSDELERLSAVRSTLLDRFYEPSHTTIIALRGIRNKLPRLPWIAKRSIPIGPSPGWKFSRHRGEGIREVIEGTIQGGKKLQLDVPRRAGGHRGNAPITKSYASSVGARFA